MAVYSYAYMIYFFQSRKRGGLGVGNEGGKRGRVKVHNDGRMSDQREVTVEVLLSAAHTISLSSRTHPLIPFSFNAPLSSKEKKKIRGKEKKRRRVVLFWIHFKWHVRLLHVEW